jgi:hypothetical protein
MTRHALLLTLAAAALAADAPDPRVEQARAALKPLKTNLKGALEAAMKEQGPLGAIEVCKSVAGQITEAASAAGVRVGRTSHKLRNPKNAPEPWMKPLLDELAKAPAKDGDFRAVALPDGALGYVEPIRVGEVCVKCHGPAVPADVQKKLAEAYPNDRATGYAPGDFRGLFWAVVPKAP